MHRRFASTSLAAAALSLAVPACFSTPDVPGGDATSDAASDATSDTDVGEDAPSASPADADQGGGDAPDPTDASGSPAGTGTDSDQGDPPDPDGTTGDGPPAAESTGDTVDTGETDDSGVGTTSGEAQESRIVFVWQGGGISPGTLGGLAGADAHCQQTADDAGLEGTYMGWLGDPLARFDLEGGPFVRVDGVTIADDWADLTDGELLAPIALTAYGEDMGDEFLNQVVTDTNPDGSNKLPFLPCDGYMGEGIGPGLGHPMATDVTWTELGAGFEAACDVPWINLYCFQQ